MGGGVKDLGVELAEVAVALGWPEAGGGAECGESVRCCEPFGGGDGDGGREFGTGEVFVVFGFAQADTAAVASPDLPGLAISMPISVAMPTTAMVGALA